MSRPQIVVADAVTPEMTQVIRGGIEAFNDARTGQPDRLPLSVVARDSTSGAVLGGALGRSSLGLLFLDLLWLPEEMRGGGLGREILGRFEAEGARRGCLAGVVYTISFQAPGFYERCGWQRFGEIACLPDGTSRIFLTKKLQAA